MSKYNLSDILNEYIGGGRIGTLKISFKDLQDKMDELENSDKVIVRTLEGPSGDGKVNREFEVVDRDSAVPGGNKQERGFTVYDYKFGFDPGSEEHFMEEYPFSVGGNDLKLAMELIDGVQPYGVREEEIEDYEKDLKAAEPMELPKKFRDAERDQIEKDARKFRGDIQEEEIDENIPPSREDNVIKDLAKADEVIDIIKRMNPDVRDDLLRRLARMGQGMDESINEGDLFSSEFDRQELKAIINDLNKGLILDMPTRRAYKFLVSLLDKEDKEEMGLNEQMYIDDEEFEMEMGRSKKDSLKKEMIFHVDQLLDGNIDMNDFMNVVEEIMAEVKSLKESTGPSDKAETEDDVVNVDKVAGPGAKGRNYGAETSANTAEDDMEDKEVANPRPMYEAPGSTINISQADMDKLHNDGKADIDGHKVVFKMNENGDVDNFANELSEEEMISKAKYDKLLDNAANRYDELEMQFTKFIKDEYNKDFDIDDFRQFQVDNSIMEDDDMAQLKENFNRFK